MMSERQFGPRRVLLCLNLVRPTTARTSASGSVYKAARYALEAAREHNWLVLHTHSIGALKRVSAIAGLEPLPSEPVLRKRSPSALSNPALFDHLADHGCDLLAIIGFSFSIDCLATSIAAAECGFKPALLREAVGNDPITCKPPSQNDPLFNVIESFARIESVANLFPPANSGGSRTYLQ